MALEIERKFLVNQEKWKTVAPQKSVLIKQAYLSTDPEKTIRVRIKADQGYITIKGLTQGISRQEFEYEIPLLDAQQLIQDFTTKKIEKIRHYILFEGKTWEVDVFEGDNAGLIIAEIELQSEDEAYAKPNWLEEEVTHELKYANSNLITHPYKNWNF